MYFYVYLDNIFSMKHIWFNVKDIFCLLIFISIFSNHLMDPIYPIPPLGQDMTQGQIFKRSLTGLKSEFSFF